MESVAHINRYYWRCNSFPTRSSATLCRQGRVINYSNELIRSQDQVRLIYFPATQKPGSLKGLIASEKGVTVNNPVHGVNVAALYQERRLENSRFYSLFLSFEGFVSCQSVFRCVVTRPRAEFMFYSSKFSARMTNWLATRNATLFINKIYANKAGFPTFQPIALKLDAAVFGTLRLKHQFSYGFIVPCLDLQ